MSFYSDHMKIAEAYREMQNGGRRMFSSGVKYLVAELDEQGVPVPAEGGNGAYGSQFLEFNSLGEAKKKCSELTAENNGYYVVVRISGNGEEKIVYRSKDADYSSVS